LSSTVCWLNWWILLRTNDGSKPTVCAFRCCDVAITAPNLPGPLIPSRLWHSCAELDTFCEPHPSRSSFRSLAKFRLFGYCMFIQLLGLPVMSALLGIGQVIPEVRGKNRGQCRTIEEQREPDVGGRGA